MNWDPLQREVLDALGFVLYRAQSAAISGLPDDPMIDALLLATGRNRDAADASHLARAWPAPAVLRGDPRAKRALWPQLRALRKGMAR